MGSTAAAVLVLVLLPVAAAGTVISSPSPSPHPTTDTACPTSCGNVSVPYPFGIRPGCARVEDFNLTCDESSNPPRMSVTRLGMGVLEIMVGKGQMRVTTYQDLVAGGAALTTGRYSVAEESAVLRWVVDKVSCEDAVKNKTSYACVSSSSICVLDINATFGYHCECSPGYQGNPYISSGCQDIDECLDPVKYSCYGNCTNTLGSYTCSCPRGTLGDPTKDKCAPILIVDPRRSSVGLGIIVGIGTGFFSLILLIGIVYSHKRWKRRNLKKLKEKHFHQNRGLLLQQLISSSEDLDGRTKIFSLEELEKATNHFDESRILGRGGHGTVYKGILSDQRVVAIKKSKITVQREIDQFINEVAILSQLNHRNVVKLFGCCLETEVPLLVYEFISNGTLSDHLHVWDRSFSLSWKNRLRIAAETSAALAYLHSAASISIFHRDVKSSNILLDDHYIAKVSDFGASRFIPLDQTRVTTMVQGTFGYLDPEYFHTGQLTEKSDVYSFGVILVELLTGQKPISLTRLEEERNLTSQFIWSLKENRLFQLLEPRVVEEGTREELEVVAKLAEICLRLRGEERPTMKEVEAQLDALRRPMKGRTHQWQPQVNEESERLLPKMFEESSKVITSRQFSLEEEYLLSMEYSR